MTFGLWDIILLIIVPTMAIIMAYVYDPRWKALILSFPLPFTLSYLSLGQPVNVTHIFGLVFLLGYTHLVRVLHRKLSIPIIFSIIISAVLYCVSGGLFVAWVPKSEVLFWSACAGVMIFSSLILVVQRAPSEPGMRSSMPVRIKAPLTFGVILVIIILKQFLQGFMTLFPMLGVFGSYEGRMSLGTNCRQIPKLVLSMVPMLVVIKLVEPALGSGAALIIGWVVFIPIMGALMIPGWRRQMIPAIPDIK